MILHLFTSIVVRYSLLKAPLVKELHSNGTADLHFIHGPVETHPPEGFEDYFGEGPYYRFIKPAEVEEGGGDTDVLERIRNFPEGANAEDQMRLLLRSEVASESVSDSGYDDELSTHHVHNNKSAQQALDYLYEIMEKQGPFDGIIGYSEGATIAATLLLHEQRRFEKEGRVPMFKCAVFFAGWPPMTPELDDIVLSDESDLMITVPTCHVSKFRYPTVAQTGGNWNVLKSAL